MYVITGGAGFLGSAVAWMLNSQGVEDILMVDNLALTEKWKNLVGIRFAEYMHKDEFLDRVRTNQAPAGVKAVIHMGACSSTTEKDADYLMQNNLHYSQAACRYALGQRARFVYASSAATYGDGSAGFDDTRDLDRLRPLNMYGFSKHLFDLWVWKQGLLDQVAGLKFFNVFGPNEWHKDDMRSVVCKAFEQIQSTGKLKLFRSHRPDIGDGEQKRDFVYVKDCAALVFWLLIRPEVCGIFNVGTGRARSFNELGRAVFKALHKDANMVYVDMPMELQGKYQYYTKADMGKLVRAGFDGSFTPLEDAVKDYVRNHLLPGYRHLDAGTENSDQTLGTAS